MLDGWIWADEEPTYSPMEFAWGDEDSEETGEESLDWDDDDDDEDDLDEEWDDDDDDEEEEEDEEGWEEWEASFGDDDDDSLGRRRTGRLEWN